MYDDIGCKFAERAAQVEPDGELRLLDGLHPFIQAFLMKQVLTGCEYEVDVFIIHDVPIDIAELDEGRTADGIGFMNQV